MNWPLMRNNITQLDRAAAIVFLGDDNRLTQGEQVAAFEHQFAEWLGCKHAVMVNSGSSANLITLAALRERVGPGEVIVPTITWSSDIASVIHAGFHPVFVDIDPRTLGMDMPATFRAINKNTKAVFVTHVLGFNAINEDTRDRLRSMKIDLIEDCCEATGATMNGKKLGTFGLASNFSFYYAHHMSTIEGGMVCTDHFPLYEQLRRLRSHGLVREMSSPAGRVPWAEQNDDLDPQFIFAEPGYNVRSTEINAVIGRSQLKRLDANNIERSAHLTRWLSSLDGGRYMVDYRTEGASNYALPLVLTEPNVELMDKVIELLVNEGVEYRRGTAGGGNQLRQPYLRRLFHQAYEKFPQTEHVHFYGLYVGNYPDLENQQIEELCHKLNAL
jgi:CDP-6-deoxy-D-xylo-4-hexulose-3-dehydrase